MKHKRELSAGQKRGLIVLAACELCLKIAAGIDIWRRPADRIKGPKAAWMAALAVNFFGPAAYFAFGRRGD